MKLLKPTIIASGHDSHKPIRLKSFLRQVAVNFGNTTMNRHEGKLIINKPEAVALSVDKLKMKRLFEKNNIPSFDWGGVFSELKHPIVIKSILHTKREPHLKKVDTQEQMNRVFDGGRYAPRWEKFYWEEFTPCDREFRIHVSRYKWSEIIATEKVLRRDRQNWVKNMSSCVFKKDFQKPKEWAGMLRDCKKVLRLAKLDFGGFDVAYNSVEGKYYVVEVNTACGMKKLTREAYSKELNKIALIKQFIG